MHKCSRNSLSEAKEHVRVHCTHDVFYCPGPHETKYLGRKAAYRYKRLKDVERHCRSDHAGEKTYERLLSPAEEERMLQPLVQQAFGHVAQLPPLPKAFE